MILWWRDLASSDNKLKPLCLHYGSAYGHNTWQDCDYSWRIPIRKFTQRSDNIVLQSHVTNENYYMSTTRVPVATKRDRMVAHIDRLLPVKLHDSLSRDLGT